ncbi:DUF6446 family protein [Dichotomicrobium thermohalophilum]|uniref:Histidine kinase n=1 Tax=Dichotomicrobium thermohalophilum TaxID=933063 RepID=A0A397Q767_9HYPH|nr:DUF6446 family protein [Dichotomicrobium thermohalophilum]RIA55645.1 hypothetical protein BXY53_0715 [Dichotomicrobium thermohalophilum]
MKGRVLIVGFLLFTVVFGAALWYFQTRAYYEEIKADSVEIAGQSYPVSDWRGIDAPTSPLKLRACFNLAEAPDAPVAEDAAPLVAPDWFDCFDAEALSGALKAGEAKAYLAARDEFGVTNRIVARFPDGRAYMWRQLKPDLEE